MAKEKKLLFNERICAFGECGKKFVIAHAISDYAYKLSVRDGIDYFCCYSHYKTEKERRENVRAVKSKESRDKRNENNRSKAKATRGDYKYYKHAKAVTK